MASAPIPDPLLADEPDPAVYSCGGVVVVAIAIALVFYSLGIFAPR